ncbi:MAG: MBOAT family protein, partial [Clostridia bacterium]|nr:MBOAT family protein [Clostridia bacterium]
SLGTFFRDYVYIPLGGNRVSTVKNIRNIMVVWLLTGFWHGASWNFLVWGLYYGLLLLAEKFLFRRLKEKLPDAVNLIVTLLLVLIGWVFFYYESLGDGLQHLGIMFGLSGAKLTDPYAIYYFKHNFLFLAASALACIPWKQITGSLPPKLQMAGSWLKPVAVSLLFLASLAMIITQSYNPFLYFRF